MLTFQAIYNKHDKWLKMAASFGIPQSQVEDVVQDLYIKMLEMQSDGTLQKIEYKDGEVNDSYIYFCIRSISTNLIRSESREVTYKSYHDTQIEEEDYDFDKDEDIECIQCAIQNLNWYDKMVFDHYQKMKMNLTKLSKDTKISYYSLRNTIRNVKKTIEEECIKKAV